MKKHGMFEYVLVFSVFLLALAGCPADDEGESNGGSDLVADAGIDRSTEIDTTGQDDTTEADLVQTDPQADSIEDDVVTSECSRTGFTPVEEYAYQDPGGMEYVAVNSTSTPYDAFMIQIFEGYDPPTGPGTYSLEGINYSDCGLCLLALADCSDSDCDKVFYAETGSVEITALGGDDRRFAGTLHDVVFDEVEIDSTTFESTPVSGGEKWCMDGYGYDEELPPTAYVGDTVEDFSLQNCASEEMVSIYDLASGQKALWFVLTAGWCPSCDQFLDETVVPYDDAHAAEGLEVIYVLGENDNFNPPNQPTIDFCRTYAARYTDADRFYIDHDGEYSFATTYAYMWPYVDEEGAIGLPWNGVVDADTKEYVYADGADSGTLEDTLTTLLSE